MQSVLTDMDRNSENVQPNASTQQIGYIRFNESHGFVSYEFQELHWSYTLYSTLLLLADLFIRIGLSVRVIMRKRPYGVSLAWLVVILVIPFLGGIFYLLFGENRLPERRTETGQNSTAPI